METPTQPVLSREAVHASRFAHFVETGSYLTLCGRLASGARVGLWRKPTCRRCQSEAASRGWDAPK